MIKKCALVGNQNAGKTLLFNVLTGLNQKVGNWPGVTVERKTGIIKGTNIEIVDLPGIYSLSPYTSEEEISWKFIVEEKPDLVVNIIDSTSIERSLYLTTQLMELNVKMLLVLNMEDILAKKGYHIDLVELEKALGVKALSISALKKTGIKELIKTIEEDKLLTIPSKLNYYSLDVEKLLVDITANIDAEVAEKRFAAVKILERDQRYYSKYYREEYARKIDDLEAKYGSDTEQIIADERYNYIEKVRDKAVTRKPYVSISSKIDRILLNKWAAIPIFIVIMLMVYLLSVGLVGGATVGIVDMLFNGGSEIEFALPFVDPIVVTLPGEGVKGLGPWLSELIIGAGGSEWAASLVADGAVAGVGAVLNFVPQLIILFVLLSLLETVGYMSRITFLFDRAFKKIGMSGKSLIPFIVGTGCSVPGIMGARTLENKEEHDITVTLTPFMPCSAKLPIISAFVGGIFMPIMGGSSWLITFSMYILAIIVIIISGYVLNKLFVKTKVTNYITELPDYHAPSAMYVLRDVWEKTWAFIKRAGTIIFLCSIGVWILLNLDYTFQFTDDVENSILANIGKSIAWIFAPMLGMNFSWGASVSVIQGLVAKEAVISSMEVITAVGEGGNIFAGNGAFGFFNAFSGLGYMIFALFSAPCFGAIGAMRRELGSSKAMWRALIFQTVLAWVLASAIGIWGVLL